MVEKTFTVTNPTGLHTRPAKQVVSEAKKYESEIMVSAGEKTASLKSMIKLMKMGISQNHTITIRCNGPDEEKALSGVVDLITNLKD